MTVAIELPRRQGLGATSNPVSDVFNTIGDVAGGLLSVITGGKARQDAATAQLDLAKLAAAKAEADAQLNAKLVPYYVVGGVAAIAVFSAALYLISAEKQAPKGVSGYNRRKRQRKTRR